MWLKSRRLLRSTLNSPYSDIFKIYKINKFLDTYDLPKLTQENINNINRSITSNEIKAVIKSPTIKPRTGWIYSLILPIFKDEQPNTFNPSTWEATAGGFLSLRPTWSTEQVQGQPGLHRETLSRKNHKNQYQFPSNWKERSIANSFY